MQSSREREQAIDPTLEALYQRPGFLLRRAHQLSVGIFEAQCRDVGLTPPQYGVLLILAVSEGIDQSTLSRALGFDRVTTLRVVRGLETRRLLRRAQSASHRNRLQLALTDAGRWLIKQAKEPADRASERLLSPLTPDERTTLTGLLTKLCAGLEPVARTRVVPPGI